ADPEIGLDIRKAFFDLQQIAVLADDLVRQEIAIGFVSFEAVPPSVPVITNWLEKCAENRKSKKADDVVSRSAFLLFTFYFLLRRLGLPVATAPGSDSPAALLPEHGRGCP
ncbi:MAG TPA: hypothetical protein PKO33_15590, partial [Pyrinomonadaceae bacterium]|nr:hypothetical protein [Pyrinomonadaceae bacterium]